MLTRSRRFALLVALPLCLALVLWPFARLYQQRARARAATLQLRAALNRDSEGRGHLSVAFIAPLLQAGGDINVRGRNDITMLHCAAFRRWSLPALQATDSEARRAALTRFLLAHGADPNTRDAMHLTPLMAATQAYRPQMVATLLQGGAKSNLEQYEPGERWTSGPQTKVWTALVMAQNNLEQLNAVDTHAHAFALPRVRREYQTEVSAARQIIALLQAATMPHHPAPSRPAQR